MLYDQPYSTPRICNIDAMIEIVESQTAETQDELGLLQIKPKYFMRKQKDIKNNEWVGNDPEERRFLSANPLDIFHDLAFGLTRGRMLSAKD